MLHNQLCIYGMTDGVAVQLQFRNHYGNVECRQLFINYLNSRWLFTI